MVKWKQRAHALLLVGILSAVTGPLGLMPAAHAAPRPTAAVRAHGFTGTPVRTCGAIEIHLTGKDRFDVHCLPKRLNASAGHASPMTNYSSDSGCSSSDIVLHLNSNYNDTLPGHSSNYLYPLCINGTGSISNFKNIMTCEQDFGFCSDDCVFYDCFADPTNWNDIASSFTTGSWYGRIYKDANLSGDWAQFNPNESCANMNFMTNSFTSGPTNFNDVASSIWVGGTYSNGRIVC